MSLSYQIDPLQRLILITCRSAAGPEDWWRCLSRLVNDWQFDDGYRILVDGRRAAPFDPALVGQVFAGIESRYPGLLQNRWAILVNGAICAALVRGLARYRRKSIGRVATFTDLRESISWLRSEGSGAASERAAKA